jgi:predicted permease
MKINALLLVLLALVISVVPFFTDCSSQSRQLTLQNGKTVPMKCHWTGRAELAVALPLAVVGALLALSKRKETRRALAIVASALGLMAILLPLVFIGVCSSAEMLCNMIMQSVLVLCGVLAIAIGGLTLLQSRGPEAVA